MKEKFLKDLEKKLSVLSTEERKDLINEYRSIIEDKVNHGKTEEEAVKEFGDIDELSKEILKAYKINPDYSKNDFSAKTNEFIKNGEELIKKGAKKLSDVTEEVASNLKQENTGSDLSQFFEIIIKVFIVLVFLAVLKIPFYIISEIGHGIFDIGTFPFGSLTGTIWKLFIEIAYVVVCVLLIAMIVSKYTNNKNSNNQVVKNNINSEPKKVEKEIKEEKNITESNVKKDDGIPVFLSVLIKFWVTIIFLIPLWCLQIGIVIAICVIIYIIIKGISIYGILLLLFGIFGMFCYFSDIIWKILFSKKNIHIYPIFINIILIIVGGLMTFDYFVNLDYVNKLPSDIKLKTITYEENIESTVSVSSDFDREIDNDLEDGKIKISITYSPDIYEDIEAEYRRNSNHLIIDSEYLDYDFMENREIFNIIIEHLKDKKIYKYSLLNEIDIRISANEKTMELLR